MSPQVFRPSAKLIQAAYVLVAVIFVAAIAAWQHFSPDTSPLILIAPALLFLAPIRAHIRQRGMKLTLDDDHLILETGLLSKTTRTLNVGKVQDVTVRQSINQRMLGIGDVTVESAGEGSAITARNFDQPKQIANLILKAAHLQAPPPKGDSLSSQR